MPSPLQPIDLVKKRVLHQLLHMRLPVPVGHVHGADCDRECHILERNYTIGLVESFIQTL